MMALLTGLFFLTIITVSICVEPDVKKKPGPVTDNRGLRTVEVWEALGMKVLAPSATLIHLPLVGADGEPFGENDLATLLYAYWQNVAAEGRSLRRDIRPTTNRNESSSDDGSDVEEEENTQQSVVLEDSQDTVRGPSANSQASTIVSLQVVRT